MKRLAELFLEFFRISLFVIGGGYAIIAVADEVFSRKGWTKEGEILDQLPVMQSVPGLIATHTAVYVGNRIAGALGALVAVVAVALPSVIVFTFVAAGYNTLPLDQPWLHGCFNGLRCALTGIIGAAILRSYRRNLRDFFTWSLMILGLFALVMRIPVPMVILASAIFGLLGGCPWRDGDSPSGNGDSPSKDGDSPSGNVKKFAISLLPLLFFLKYGLLGFGGGFVLVPMYLDDFIGPSAPFLQLSANEFADIMSLSQMTPGPVGVNCATFFGFRLAGIVGALIASVCLLVPGSLIAFFAFRSLDRYQSNRVIAAIMRGIRPASIALMLVAFYAFATVSLSPGGVMRPEAAIIVALVSAMVLGRRLGVVKIVFLAALVGMMIL